MKPARLFCTLCLGAALPVMTMAAPRVVLSPSMVSDIKEVAAQATRMEQENRGQLEAIANIRNTMETIDCVDDDQDPGCQRAKDSLRRAYIDYLQNLENAIPGMRESLGSTVRQLKREVASMARENSLADIQAALSGARQGTGQTYRHNRIGGGSSNQRVSISRLVSSYSSAIPGLTGQGGGNSMTARSVAMYLDFDLALEEMAVLEQNINEQRILLEVDSAFEDLSPEAVELLSDVQTILFGESSTAPAPVFDSEDIDLDSPVNSLPTLGPAT